MKLDIDHFMHFLKDRDMTLEQKAELIRDMWVFLQSLADEEDGTHPVQNVICFQQKKLQRQHKTSLESKQARLKRSFKRRKGVNAA
jgi:hypothetical protein